jgi:TolB-like protein/DNA-binding SARP family transcriptional activator
MRWSLRLFGRFELSALSGRDKAALPGKRERVLLACLALSPDSRQQRRKLATLLWGDASDETALDNLRTSLWSLRKALGDTEHSAIASDGEDIVLDVSAFEVDAVAFRRLAAQSGRSELEEAANLYSGELLDGLDIENDEFESWRRAEAARAKDQAVDVLLRLMTQLGTCGETEAAIEIGTRLLRLEPLHEPAVRRLMRLYGESGRRGPAAQLYRALADALKTELDAQPEAETRAVLAEISRGGEEPAQALTALAAPPAADTKASTHSTNIVGPRVTPGELPHTKARRLQWILAGGLAAVIAILLLYQFVPWSGRTAENPTVVAGTISIAVLPFANLSAEPEQEFFSDGMTEEITSALAKIPDLRVVGRTSAFQFKGEKKDLRAIGRALGATHLIEGSVRKAGTRVRIAAQLIKADDGTQVWTENYDRELTDVFAIQEDIAKAIATAFQVRLGLKLGETLITSRIADPAAYDQFLQLRSPAFRPTLDVLEAFVARAPGFAPGWAMLAGGYRGNAAVASRRGDFTTAAFLTDKEEAAARKAIELDPSYAVGYSELAGVQTRRGKWAESEDLYKRALSLDPSDSALLNPYSQSLAAVGRFKEALRVRERLRVLEPLGPSSPITARIMLADGQIDSSIVILEKDLSTNFQRNLYLAEAYAAKGWFVDAAETLLRITTEIDRRSVEDAVTLLRSAPNKSERPVGLPALDGELGFVYAYVGAPERVLEYPETSAEQGNFASVQAAWRPSAAPLRKTERFKALMRKVGLVDYWRARGWPDLCHPIGADDFACD